MTNTANAEMLDCVGASDLEGTIPSDAVSDSANGLGDSPNAVTAVASFKEKFRDSFRAFERESSQPKDVADSDSGIEAQLVNLGFAADDAREATKRCSSV